MGVALFALPAGVGEAVRSFAARQTSGPSGLTSKDRLPTPTTCSHGLCDHDLCVHDHDRPGGRHGDRLCGHALPQTLSSRLRQARTKR